MVREDTAMLNSVYREISERLGEETAVQIYEMFKGQQICFPVRFYSPACLRQQIAQEYNGTNIRALAAKYSYSEKTIRRILKDHQKY